MEHIAESISENGFVILKNCIDRDVIESIHGEILSFFCNGIVKGANQEKLYALFLENLQKNSNSEYNFTLPIFNQLLFKELFEKILNSEKLYRYLTDLLGRDLAFCVDPSITLNVPDKSSPKENYLFKDWHQEIWSGASPSTVQIWTPLLHKNSQQGQMELIISSHKWGHIPHRNRSPIELPKEYETKTLNLEYGDAIVFSTLLLHRSLKTSFPRLALPMLLKNFKYVDNSFQNNRNWKIFSYSEMTKIERILGNHFLSPFRTTK